MILYHGSNVVVEAPKIIRAEIGRDFGFGFYTTDIKDQAVRWAIRKAKLAQRRNGAYTPYLSIYSFDPDTLDHLKYKAFPDPSAEWLDTHKPEHNEILAAYSQEHFPQPLFLGYSVQNTLRNFYDRKSRRNRLVPACNCLLRCNTAFLHNRHSREVPKTY